MAQQGANEVVARRPSSWPMEEPNVCYFAPSIRAVYRHLMQPRWVAAKNLVENPLGLPAEVGGGWLTQRRGSRRPRRRQVRCPPARLSVQPHPPWRAPRQQRAAARGSQPPRLTWISECTKADHSFSASLSLGSIYHLPHQLSANTPFLGQRGRGRFFLGEGMRHMESQSAGRW